jgi:hypothetical protein
MSATIVAFKPRETELDPIYAKIEAHRIATATVTEAAHISCNIEHDDPGYMAAQDKSAEACDQLTAALRALLACHPTTMTGLLAMLDYVGQPKWLDDDDDEEGNTILSGSHEYNDLVENEAKEFPRTIAAALRKMIEG